MYLNTADMTPTQHFLVAGGTGRQGGAVVSALLSDPASPIEPARIHVITRSITGPTAVKLSAKGISLVEGSLGQPGLIFDTLQKQDIDLHRVSIFLAQAHGPTELSDAKLFIDAASTAGIEYFVYSSVDRGGKEASDKDPSYCKTFSDKYHIEKHLIATAEASRRSQAPNTGFDYTILRPTWFAENAIWGFPGQLCMTGWRENMNGKRMQVVTAEDLGRWAAEALLRPDRTGIRNTAISIASDYLSFDDVNTIFREETGQPVAVTYGLLARLMIWLVTDLRTMFGFVNERDYGADLEWLSKYVKPTTMREFVRETVGAKKFS